MTLPANARIIDLPAGTTPTGVEPFESVQNGISVQLTQTQLALSNAPALSVRGNPTDATAPVQDVVGAANQVLRVNSAGTSWSWGQVNLASSAAVTGTLPIANAGTGIITYTLGDILYSDATNSLAKLAGNITTTRKFLRQTGNGAVSAAPVWDTILAADVPAPGSDTQVLFNDSGVLGADAGFVYAKATDRLGVAGGMRVGFAGVATGDDIVEVGDANFLLNFNAGTPFLGFDSGDFLVYSRAANQFLFQIGSATQVGVGSNLIFPNTTDVVDIGTTTLRFNNIFLKQTGKIDFGNGDVTITGAANTVTFAGADSGYVFTPTGASNNVSIRANVTYSTYGSLSFNGSHTATTMLGLFAGAVGDNTMYYASAGTHQFRVADVATLNISSLLFSPVTNDVVDIGNGANRFSNLFLKQTGKIDFGNGDTLITGAANNITFSGGSYAFQGGVVIQDASAVQRFSFSTSDSGFEIGRVDNVAGTAFIDFHTGATTVDFDVRVQATGGTGVSGGGNLQIGAALIIPAANDGTALGTGTLSFSDLFLASGAVINFNNSNYTITHSAGLLTTNGNLSLTTSGVLTTGTIELGAASDTTISRSAAGVIAVEGVPLFSNIPQNSQSTAYTTVLADAQKHIFHPTADNNARTFTIDSNANVAYPVGTAITFVNKINTVTISITSDTLTLAGAGTTGSRTLAANGIATALKIATTEWMISGTGLT